MNRYTIYLIVFIMAATMPTQAQEVLFPAQNAKNVNIDTHLVLHFTDSPTIGEKGCIKVYEEGSNRLVDCLDLSIPAGPTEKERTRKLLIPRYLMSTKQQTIPMPTLSPVLLQAVTSPKTRLTN